MTLHEGFGENVDFQAAMQAALDSVAYSRTALPLVKAQNDFATRLLARLEGRRIGLLQAPSSVATGATRRQNLLISPTSLWQTLALTAGGAQGETKRQLKQLLATSGLKDEEVGAANRALNAVLTEQVGAMIMVANSVWFHRGFSPEPTFVERAQHDFKATVGQFSEHDLADGAQRINEWVSAQTQGEIPCIVEAGSLLDLSALLVNAVYFRARWSIPFGEHQTKPKPFHLANGRKIEVSMMHGREKVPYLRELSFEGVKLAYENTSYAMWALLPNRGKTPTDVLRELGGESLRQLKERDTIIAALPRFEISWGHDLKEELAAMNAPLPFSRAADFRAMGTPVERISKVLHVCKMRVDEEGTIATAATAVFITKSIERERPKTLVFDRPFVVVLVEETSGARLFEGTVYDPRG